MIRNVLHVRTCAKKADDGMHCCFCHAEYPDFDDGYRWDVFQCYLVKSCDLVTDFSDPSEPDFGMFYVCNKCRMFAVDKIVNKDGHDDVFMLFADDDSIYKMDGYSGLNY